MWQCYVSNNRKNLCDNCSNVWDQLKVRWAALLTLTNLHTSGGDDWQLLNCVGWPWQKVGDDPGVSQLSTSFSSSRRLAQSCSYGVAIETFRTSWDLGSKLVHCHFCLILLANANKILMERIFHKDFLWKEV